MNKDYMNYRFEIEKVLREQIEIENRNTMQGMSCKLELREDESKNLDSPGSLQVILMRSDDYRE